MLLDKDNDEITSWHYASYEGNVEVLQKLWEWGKGTLSAEELKNELFKGKDIQRRTACHYASYEGNVEVLQKLWEWGKVTLTAEELKMKCN
jgi:ankyrin repeat protein